MKDFAEGQWALVLGGSSGMGLATADKLSRHGMNVCVVHRDRKGAMGRIQPAFDAIAARVGFRAYNLDGLSPEGRETVLAGLTEAMGERGRVRVLLHSIAFANLRLVAPQPPARPAARAREALAAALGIDAERVGAAVASLFDAGDPAFVALADGATYDSENLLEEEDLARTVHAMGTSLVTWVQALLGRKLFTDDARVFGLTSEGNRIAWRGYAAAAAAKAALESAARSLAVECAPFGVRCNIVQAGVTRTPALALIPGSQHIIAASLARNPMGRLTTPEDVANLICLLATDEAAWVNGALITCDGGEHLG